MIAIKIKLVLTYIHVNLRTSNFLYFRSALEIKHNDQQTQNIYQRFTLLSRKDA